MDAIRLARLRDDMHIRAMTDAPQHRARHLVARPPDPAALEIARAYGVGAVLEVVVGRLERLAAAVVADAAGHDGAFGEGEAREGAQEQEGAGEVHGGWLGEGWRCELVGVGEWGWMRLG